MTQDQMNSFNQLLDILTYLTDQKCINPTVSYNIITMLQDEIRGGIIQ